MLIFSCPFSHFSSNLETLVLPAQEQWPEGQQRPSTCVLQTDFCGRENQLRETSRKLMMKSHWSCTLYPRLDKDAGARERREERAHGAWPRGTGHRKPFQTFSHWFLPLLTFPFLFSLLSHLCLFCYLSVLWWKYGDDDDICVYVFAHTCVCLSASQLLMPFSNCLTYSFFEYLLIAYYVPFMVLGTGAIAVNKQTEILASCLHRLYIQIGRGQCRKDI